MSRTKGLIPFLLVVALAACGSSTVSNSAPGSSDTPQSSEPIKLTDFKVDVRPALAAQQTTFRISNDGGQQHELLVFMTHLDPSQFPTETSGDMKEDGAGVTKVSDGDNLDPGKSQTRTVDLTKPGKYVFVCNLPGHFKLGMYTTVTVK
jgi:uncharacterized cupredoxin-like copper-binding protein